MSLPAGCPAQLDVPPALCSGGTPRPIESAEVKSGAATRGERGAAQLEVSAVECSGSMPRPIESVEVQGGAATRRDPAVVLEGAVSAIGRRDRPSGHSREALWRSPASIRCRH